MAGNVTVATATASAVAPQSPTNITAVVTTRAGNVDKPAVRVSQSLLPLELITTATNKTPENTSFAVVSRSPAFSTIPNTSAEQISKANSIAATILTTPENVASTSSASFTLPSVTSSTSSATSSATVSTTSSAKASSTRTSSPIRTTNTVTSKLSQSHTSNTRNTTLPTATGIPEKVKVLLSEKVSVIGANILETPSAKVSSSQFGLPPISQKRKFSFPAALHANLLGLSSSNSDPAITTNASTRRRFSNVGDVVSRKLSNTIGWRTLPVPPQEVVAQGKALCCQYIRNRLKRSGIFNKKLGLYRLRSVVGTPSAMIVTEVYPSLVTAGQELERMHPKVFSNIARQANSTPAGVIVSDKAAATLILAIGREIIKTDITWGKVVAVFAVAGGLAVDCVCQGHPEYLHGLVEGVTDLLEEELAEWIASNGGWTSLAAQCRTPTPEVSTSAYLSIFGIFIAIVFVFYIVFKFCCRIYSL